MRLLLLALALVAGVLTPAVGVPSAAAAPQDDRPVTGIGVRLVDVPTSAADNPRARSYIVDHVKPGAVIERRIEVVNHTGGDGRVAVYPAGATITEGGFTGASGHTQNEVSGWTSATPKALELGPEERSFVKVTITVPADAVRGEKYGVVWAETTTTPTTPGGLTQVSRVGIRVYLSVGPGGAPPTDFEIVSLTGIRDENNVAAIQASVRNTGERALDLNGTLNLSKGPAGLSAGPFPVPVGTTLGIGESAPVLVPLDAQLPNGPWLAKITMTSGITERTAQATLTFPSGPGTGIGVPPDSGLGWWTIFAAILALALLLALGAVLVRRRSRRRDFSDRAGPRRCVARDA